MGMWSAIYTQATLTGFGEVPTLVRQRMFPGKKAFLLAKNPANDKD